MLNKLHGGLAGPRAHIWTLRCAYRLSNGRKNNRKLLLPLSLRSITQKCRFHQLVCLKFPRRCAPKFCPVREKMSSSKLNETLKIGVRLICGTADLGTCASSRNDSFYWNPMIKTVRFTLIFVKYRLYPPIIAFQLPILAVICVFAPSDSS